MMTNKKTFRPHYTKSFSLFMVTVAYIASFGVGLLSLNMSGKYDLHPIWDLAIADVAATLAIFAFSLIFRNSSFYDAYWSVAPVVFLYFWQQLGDADTFREILVFAAVWIWGIRLTLNWARGWTGIKHEDWRYGMLKKNGGLGAVLVDFFGIHFFPTVMVFLGCLPLYPAFTHRSESLGFMDLLAFIVCLLAVVIETLADEQLRLFKSRIKEKSEFMKSGIWKYSRHPNYFGEFLFWVGIFLFGISAGNEWWWTGAGVLAMFLMFNLASIPMMDKRMCESRPEYKDHMKKVSGFFLFPPLKK